MANYVVVSLEGSGSTYIWQVVSEFYKAGRVGRAHTFVKPSANKYVFFSYRDPRDVLCSYAKRLFRQMELESGINKSFETLFVRFKRQEMIKNYLACSRNSQLTIIKYEDYFKGNEEKLVKFISEKMKLAISNVQMGEILNKFSIENNKKRASKFESFGQWDKNTHIHGNHISSGGEIGVWKKDFTEANKLIVREGLGDLLVTLGYEKDLNW